MQVLFGLGFGEPRERVALDHDPAGEVDEGQVDEVVAAAA